MAKATNVGRCVMAKATNVGRCVMAKATNVEITITADFEGERLTILHFNPTSFSMEFDNHLSPDGLGTTTLVIRAEDAFMDNLIRAVRVEFPEKGA